MTLALTSASLVVFGLYGVRLVREERTELMGSLESSSMLLARGVQVSVENALRDGQAGDVIETLEALNAQDDGTESLIIGPDGRSIVETRSRRGSSLVDLEAVARVADVDTISYIPEESPTHIAVTLPMFNDAAEPLGTIVIARPLKDIQDDLRRTSRDVALSVLMFVLAAGLLGLGLGRLYISAPLEALADAMRSVRLGDLRSGLHFGQRDEIAAVGEEFDAMVTDLRETRVRLQQESDSKRRIEAGLQEASRLITVGQLAASLAHEIGSPLQVLGGRARLLLANTSAPEQVRHNAAIIAEQSDRIAGIVSQLLGIVRQPPAPYERIDLGATVRAVVDLMQFEAERRGSRLTLSVENAVPPVQANPGEVQQVALNLLTNALHATPSGRAIRVIVRPGTLERPTGFAVPACSLIVEDEGEGISPEVLQRIFEPFFTTRAHKGGTGLGLAVVTTLLEHHRGSLRLTSEPGRGTRVEAIFPIDPSGDVVPKPEDL